MTDYPHWVNLVWAKTPRGQDRADYHPLLCHLLDVTAVTAVLWQLVLSAAGRKQLAEELGVDERAAEWWICFWAGSHDIGKCSPAFARVNKLRKAELAASGFTFYGDAYSAPHGTIGAYVLRSTLIEAYGLKPKLARRIGQLVGGHHGVFPSTEQVTGADHDPIIGRGRWAEARSVLLDLLAQALGPRPRVAPTTLDNATALMVAGLISVADWIGSNTDFFDYAVKNPIGAPPAINPEVYMKEAIAKAGDALQRLGWLGWTPPETPRAFTDLFPDVPEPNSMQEEVIRQATLHEGPTMVIVEAPMGEGKSEAAMYLADRWAATQGARGCYFALPTMATSDQMFNRVREFLLSSYPAHIVNLQLLHGRSSVSAEFEELLRHGDRLFAPAGIEEDSDEGVLPSVIATQWFTYRNRGLLAPFAVGTVDQALLATLQMKHVFVRVFGLAHKTLIVDEVHAYDTYMTTLLERLLEWEGACGSSVVLLSATLPAERRRQLAGAFLRGQQLEPPPPRDKPYPRVTSVSSQGVTVEQVRTSNRSRKTIVAEWVDGTLPRDGNPFGLGERLRDVLSEGGCAAIICNTVARAQDVYAALRPIFSGDADDGERCLDLFHARFLFHERDRRARRCMRRFGKPRGKVAQPDGRDVPVRRPHCAVLVATQVVEQSLDLDFDLMITDLAPTDLVLQRAGRLHRHRRNRPDGLGRPHLWIVAPGEGNAGIPRFDPGTEAVYDRHVLLRSWLTLRTRIDRDDPIRVPDDVEEIIESTYGERPFPGDVSDDMIREWTRTREEMVKRQKHHAYLATAGCIMEPDSAEDILSAFSKLLEEQNPDVHRTLRAQTRLGDDSVDVVFLTGAHWDTVPAGTPSTAEARELLARSVGVSDHRVIHDLKKCLGPGSWSRSPLLRHHRLVLLDREDGPHANCFGRWRFALDNEIGLSVVAHGKERETSHRST
jgi:CRISPR-associated endonuclease/helicase Cas3